MDMNIEIGTQYENKTWRFLLPCLRAFGDSFILKFNTVMKLAVGIGDKEFPEDRRIYILCDADYREIDYKVFLNWVSKQPYFLGTYKNGLGEMLVLRFPKRFYNAYDKFIEGKYSQMFTEDEINILFSEVKNYREKSILNLEQRIIPDFIKKLNEEFNTNLKEKDFSEPFKELELPPKFSEEIFNNTNNNFINGQIKNTTEGSQRTVGLY